MKLSVQPAGCRQPVIKLFPMHKNFNKMCDYALLEILLIFNFKTPPKSRSD